MSIPKLKMYVLVRKDLSTIYGNVQGAHALAQYASEHADQFKQWGNQYLIFLGVRNLIELREWVPKLKSRYKKISVFREPDMDNQEMAIACYDNGNIFEDLHMA